MKILGAWSGHDCSYSILKDGKPVIHDEFERFIREKEPGGDSVEFFFDKAGKDHADIDWLATCEPFNKIKNYSESFEKIKSIVGDNIIVVGHHQAHAANAFFSSNYKTSLIITIDGGGKEVNNIETACTIWRGEENKINHIATIPMNQFNIGGMWTRATRYIFKLQSGWPYGHQAGSVMAMAAFGDKSKYHNDFMRMLTVDLLRASFKPGNQPRGPYTGNDPVHPYLDKWQKIADKSEQDRFDVAAGLQSATETLFRDLLKKVVMYDDESICLAGGVSLNCVLTGKIKEWFPQIKNIFVTPVPHDGGLAIGASQYLWHHVLDNPRIEWKNHFTPYLGKTYARAEVDEALLEYNGKVKVKDSSLEEIVDLLDKQNIVSVFGGGSESGRRALGNRSILADPRSLSMKDLINKKVKHRQWFRPFAPSILESEVDAWFKDGQKSPYMSFALEFKDEVKEKVPAVVHQNGTARLQTVSKNDNEWYHSFLTKWNEKSGVPVILNTSFNDREPICETPQHALNCFLGTNIDYLYFYDYNLLIEKFDEDSD